jgi:MinD-like ATPase involved in chromosome partitioning or flagellar assembly
MMQSSLPDGPWPLREVITFYSYKGGTGRTMALANIACLLTRDNGSTSRVLAIDWDLEAPGLHYYLRPSAHDTDPACGAGVVEYFTRVRELIETPAFAEANPADADAILAQMSLTQFRRPTNVPNVDLMPAGLLDASYRARLAALDWHLIYQRVPGLFRAFARQVTADYDVVLVDSRTGMTDISGICTSLLPDKLVVVFTPNEQSLSGVRRLVSSSVEYRQSSSDVRSLLVYPLPSRMDMERDTLRRLWRHGDGGLPVEGFQPLFEQTFRDAYALESCDLSGYFDEVQVQHSPDYAYGERIAALDAAEGDRFSIVRSYQALLRWLVNSAAPWETPEAAQGRTRLELVLRQENAALEQTPPFDPGRLFELQEEVVRLSGELRGPQHLETVSAVERLVETGLRRGGDVSRSISVLNDMAAALQQMTATAKLKAVGTIVRASAVLRANGHLEAADRLLTSAIDSSGPPYSDADRAAEFLEAVATDLRATFALTEATALQQRVVDIRSHLLGANHPETLTSMDTVAEMLRDHGELSDAEVLQRRVLELRRHVLGEEHTHTLVSMENLAETLRGRGDIDEARRLQERVHKVRQQHLGREHPDTLRSMNSIASILWAQGDLSGARLLQEEVLRVRQEVLGDDHPDTVTAMGNLAETLRAQGEVARARSLQDHILQARRRRAEMAGRRSE